MGSIVARLRNSLELFDAGGLAFFAVSGAQKALDWHLGPAAAMLLGMLTGIGGGMLRDVLSAEVPVVLRGDIYAIAATPHSGSKHIPPQAVRPNPHPAHRRGGRAPR